MLSVKRPGGNFLVGNEQISIPPSRLWFRLELIYGFYFTEEQQEDFVMVRVEIQDVTPPTTALCSIRVLGQRDPQSLISNSLVGGKQDKRHLCGHRRRAISLSIPQSLSPAPSPSTRHVPDQLAD